MNRTTRTWRVGAVAMAAGLALTACGSSDDGGGSGDSSSSGGGGSDCTEQNLAFLGALTGDAGALGVNMTNGIQLAVDEYNKDAECKVGLKKFDSQGSPDKAPALATQIVGDDTIIGLVGPGFSGESLATGKTFFEAGMPSVSPSATNVTITDQGWTTWHRVIGNDNAQGEADAKYLMDTVKAKKVYVVDDAQDYSVGLSTVVKDSLGSAVTGSDQIQVGQTDMSAVVTKVTAAKADAVFYGGYYTEAGLLVKQLRQAGWKGTFMSGDGSQDPAFVKVAGQAANGAVLSAPAAPAPADFAAKVKEATGNDAGLYTTQSYDAANIFLQAIKDGKTEPKDINDFIGSYDSEGVSGPISFDEKGDIKTSKIYAYEVKNGKMDVENPTAIE
ncbi:branched-chain amino acid ABC transporter substrate-binding protein [Phycicoccus flavus]|uniref:branched-chain amino acid ABC transporter substrate-binding protein n=1 Tax=Phycicoccus flavus TaxID=2502783 RepID=UPI000FEBA3E2|nr:branched-chain amino acid ABC transporter substrate-binding protein [Phycicoccus flavus]NHA67535.1 branched-chain amino acid ABC transporter substrate-binding protein [Phycicoccus flavus]